MSTTALYLDKGKKKGEAADKKSDPLVKTYLREIERYNRATSSWYEESDNIEKVYLDETRVSEESRKFALLWANVETLKPAIYGKLPTVLCSRRYKDKDVVARIASEMIERATNTSLDLYNSDETFRMVRDDRLLSGRGQGWVRYEATIERSEEEIEVLDPNTNEMVKQSQTNERLVGEKVCNDYVNCKDFGHNVAQTWSNVWLVWRIVYKTEEEAIERFGSEAAAKLSYGVKAAPAGTGKDDASDHRCKIYEIWDKTRSLTSWLAEGQTTFLESGKPPISFRNGFPCPEPCYATKTSKSLIPKPDYVYYRDQAREINDLTDKIGRLTQWLMVKGFFPGGPSSIADPIEEVLRDKTNAELFVKVDSWKEFQDRGGAGKMIDWLPIEAIVKALQAAINARNQLIQDVFQLTGISDILRGQTDPNETLGAQELKAQTGSRRLKNTRDDMQRWCRDMALLNAEVIAEQFSPQTLSEITGFKYMPPAPPMMIQPPQGMSMGMQPPMQPGMQPPMSPMMGHNGGPQMQGMGADMQSDDPGHVFDDRVIELLRNDRMRSFRIEVETDQTGQADEDAMKQRNVEMLNVVGGYLERSVPIVGQAPEFAPVVKEMLLTTLRGFRTGKGLEDILDNAFTKTAQAAQAARQSAGQHQDPKMVEVQQRGQIASATLKQEGEIKVAEMRQTAAIDAQEQQTRTALQVRQQNIDAALKSDQTRHAASAQAQSEIAKALIALRPTSTVQ